MTYFMLGLLLWAVLHLMPAAAPTIRQSLVQRLGEKPYKALFSLAIVAAICLIVIGWQASEVKPEYQPASWGRMAAVLLMAPALLLFISGRKANNLRRLVRHPQLSGVLLICVAHLLANGDNRSVLLFMTLGGWSLLQMYYINQRDGEWQKPQPFPLTADVISVAIAAVAYSILLFAHPYLTGIALL